LNFKVEEEQIKKSVIKKFRAAIATKLLRGVPGIFDQLWEAALQCL